MVIGNGLIANSFCKAYGNDPKVLVFASGVSNSRCTDVKEFQREFQLVKDNSNFNGLFIYFSTCSIEDPSLRNSQYIKHKNKIELYISQNITNYLIVRLPNVIGKTKNPNTLTNFFYKSIITNNPLVIQMNAYRYFVEIDDVFKIVDIVIKESVEVNTIINLVVGENISALDVLLILEKISGKKSIYTLIEGSSMNYSVKVSTTIGQIVDKIIQDKKNYVKNSLLKNYSSIPIKL